MGCGRCVEVCPHNVFNIFESKAYIMNKDRCMECSACVKNCAVSAIEVKPGVGCASYIITTWLTGSEPDCGCSNDTVNNCC